MLLIEVSASAKGDNRADSAHKINDAVSLRSLAIRSDVRHERNGRRAIQAHRQVHQNHEQHERNEASMPRN
ncbi:hypothetical protein D3C80_2064700 [compost metagenome]